MNYRLNGTRIAMVGILLLIAISVFVYTMTLEPAPDEVLTEEPKLEKDVPQAIISGKHQYKDSIHTIAGMAEVPTPCHGVVVEPLFLETNDADTITVELRFTTVLEGEECPATVSDTSYRVTFEAPEQAIIRATWNGANVELNLVPVGPEESLDEEFYFKG